jgi:methylmalonyl-CoA/ethylmalonyl-CoA epimerase
MSLISHIGIAVDDLDRAIAIFSKILGIPASGRETIIDQKVEMAFFENGDGGRSGRIELLAAIDKSSPIARFLEKRGPGLHHLAVRVADLEEKLAVLKDDGYRLIDESPRIGAGGKKIAFIHPSAADGVLIELEEE